MSNCKNCGGELFRGQTGCPVCWYDQLGPLYQNVRFGKYSKREPKGKTNDKGPCFVATVVFENPYCYELSTLRNFRDNTLSKMKIGRNFIDWYYKNGKNIAEWVEKKKNVKVLLKNILSFFVRILNFKNK